MLSSVLGELQRQLPADHDFPRDLLALSNMQLTITSETPRYLPLAERGSISSELASALASLADKFRGNLTLSCRAPLCIIPVVHSVNACVHTTACAYSHTSAYPYSQ